MLHLRPTRRITTHVETVHGELCIYEWTTKTVHALNPAAARVWEMCDGSTTIEEMSVAVGRDLNTQGARSIVGHALAQFDRAGLLEPGIQPGVGPQQLSRRTLLRRIGVAAAIPVVTSIIAPTPLAAQSGNTHQFTYTGAAQSFTVPAGVTVLNVDAYGAVGSGFAFTAVFGFKGRVQAVLPVTPAEVLTIVVGGRGAIGGFNGGGAFGANGLFNGGGASDVRRGSTLLIVAGGGGGAGRGGSTGGAGGGLVGAAGTGGCGGGGGGGTASAGGAGGLGGSGGGSGSPGLPGQGGTGGDGDPATLALGGGGGGGGYFGGGGGGGCGCGTLCSTAKESGGGGGGSSYTDPSATGVVHTQGFDIGGSGITDGVIVLTW